MRRNLLITVLAMIVVAVLAFFLVFKPQSDKIAQAREDVKTAQDDVERLRLELQRLQALQQQAPKLREEATKLDAAVPNDPQLAAFILQVQEAANASGIEWVSVSPTPPVASTNPQAPVQEVVVAMNVEGGYFQVQDFLVRLENLPRAVKIGNVGLSVLQASSGSPRLGAVLNMKMFVSTPAAAPAPTPVPAG